MAPPFAMSASAARPGEIVGLVGVEGSGARELLRSLAGLEVCSGTIEIAGAKGDAAQRLSAYVPATRSLSLYSNFSVGENLLVRLGKPDIAGFGMALKKKRMRRLADEAIRRFSIKSACRLASHPLAFRRQSAESGDRPGAQLRPAAVAARGADAGRRHSQQAGDLPAAARLRRERTTRSSCSAPKCWKSTRPSTAPTSSSTVGLSRADRGQRLRPYRSSRHRHRANGAPQPR